MEQVVDQRRPSRLRERVENRRARREQADRFITFLRRMVGDSGVKPRAIDARIPLDASYWLRKRGEAPQGWETPALRAGTAGRVWTPVNESAPGAAPRAARSTAVEAAESAVRAFTSTLAEVPALKSLTHGTGAAQGTRLVSNAARRSGTRLPRHAQAWGSRRSGWRRAGSALWQALQLLASLCQAGWETAQTWDPREVFPRAVALILVLVFAEAFLLHGMTRQKARAAEELGAAATPAAAAQPAVVSKPAEKTSILILGSDKREADASFRTDVIVLVTVDPARGEVSTVSFPRDLVAKLPGYGDDRINVVMQYGGFKLMQDTLENSYGARPQYYLMTNFDGFTGIINSIGGIEVEAAQPLVDACDLYWSRAGQCEIQPGKHKMDGATALWYIRSRHTSSDFDRLRRAQEVLTGMLARFMSMDALSRMPELYAQYHGDVETNMDIAKMLSLAPVAAQVLQDPSRIHKYAIPEEVTADWFMASGARVLLPNYDAVKKIIQDAGAGE